MRYSQEQDSAVDLCADMTVRIAGVTGAAGTGKTTVIKRLVQRLREDGRSVALAAPTGRAAKRITEATGLHAQTLHKLLRYPMPDDDPPDPDADPNVPRHDHSNPLPYQVVVVDEASMIGPTLYDHLMDAMKPGSCVRFFGDNNQLSPVEDGDPPFVDILVNKPSVWLTYNYRSDDALIANAQRVLEGRVPIRNERFEVIYDNDPIARLLAYAAETPELGTDQCQIITPTRKGKFGTERLNPSLQLRFNPKGPVLKLPRFKKWRPKDIDAEEDDAPTTLSVRAGDKFIWIKNDYELALFNGEIGRITEIDTEHGGLVIDTADKHDVEIPPVYRVYSQYHGHMIQSDPRKAIDLGYAITTHKSQGSEFDTVVYVICSGQAWMLNRRNFYTAITRARHRVVVITDHRALRLSMRKEQR